MKKRLTYAVLVAFLFSVFTFSANAQTEKQIREQRRAAAAKLEIAQIKQMLLQKSFFFQAQQLSYSDNPNYQNITLNQNNYGIWVYPNTLNVMLPVLGGTPMLNPQLNQSLSYTTKNFSYQVTQNPNGLEWTVVMRSLNMWTLNAYDFNLKIDKDGYGTLIVSNPYISEVIFTGMIQAQ